MPSLLVISIGPVQEFIASARRSRDLWYGSWLLSELSKAAALHLATTCGVEKLIFPAVDSLDKLAPAQITNDPEDVLNVANKVVAIVPDKEIVETVATDVEKAVCTRLTGLRDKAWGKVRGPFEDRTLAEAQVDALLEFVWAAVHYNEEEGYKQARDTCEALLAARKVTRDFAQMVGTAQPKSSLDGLRESVIPEGKYPNREDSDDARNEKIKALYDEYGAGRAERLSGVDLLKRKGSWGVRFPSTSHIAALPFLALLGEGRLDKLAALAKALSDIGVKIDERKENDSNAPDDAPLHDLSFLFNSRLTDSPLNEAKLKEAREVQSIFFRDHTNKREPLPYYALLQADGDRMGVAIDHQTTDEGHKRISGALARFANQVRAIVSKHQGALVYCGGDDVLAFLPLHTAVECAKDLATTFAHEEDGLGKFKDENGNAPTLSAGLVIVHHLEPLSDALHLVREAERKAKTPGMGDRNALAITLSKRGGADRTIWDKWGAMDARLTDFVALHRRDQIPDGAAYDLGRIADEMGLEEGMAPDDPLMKAARGEAVRILKRKRSQHGERALDDDKQDDDKTVLGSLVKKIMDKQVPVQQLALELIIASFLAQAADMAGVPLSTTQERPQETPA